jgi:hypothetical protein
MSRAHLFATSAFVFVSTASLALAQDKPPADVNQTIQATQAEADRIFQALQKESKKDVKKDGIELKLQWKVSGTGGGVGSSWFLKGRLVGLSKVTKHTSPLGWVTSVLSPSNQSVEFDYDKPVLIRYSTNTHNLSITLEEGAQVTGKYNVVVTATGSAKLDASASPNLNLQSPNFSVSASFEKEKYSVAVTGLPYIISPEVIADRVDGFLRLRLGVAWQSECDLSAVPVQGQTNKVSFDLSYSGGSVIKGDMGTANSTFKSAMKLSAIGKGLVGRIVYDETDSKLDYEMDFEADASWSLQVDDYPMMQVGSAHFETSKDIKPGFFARVFKHAKPPAAVGEGIETPAPVAQPLMMSAGLNPAAAKLAKISNLYVQPEKVDTGGLIKQLPNKP